MKKIINEINLENGSKYKMNVLKKYPDNELLKKLLKMTYDKADYTFGITMKNVNIPESKGDIGIEWALERIEEKLVSREKTGHAAIAELEYILESLSPDDAKIIGQVINRDLRINLGRSSINKVYKGLIKKPLYMRCDLFTLDKTLPELDKKGKNKVKKGSYRNIDFKKGAVIQLKADGTYREFTISTNTTVVSRAGEDYTYPKIQTALNNLPEKYNGVIHGELTVRLDDKLLDQILPKLLKEDAKNDTDDAGKIKREYQKSKDNGKEYILPRGIGNGLISSDDVPYDNLILDIWDFITPEDYVLAGLKDKKNPPKVKYRDRFEMVKGLIKELNDPDIRVIESIDVHSFSEAMKFVSEKMNMGLEGGVLKNLDFVFKDGTSKDQLKMKLIIELEMRCIGFHEGKKGTSREATFGSMIFENDERSIRGKCSGFSDEKLKDFNARREELIGKVFTLKCTDITKARSNPFHALSYAQFIEFREKDTTDTLEVALKNKQMAMELKDLI